MKRIVIATDGSPAAEEAIEAGLELAVEQDAGVTFVHVAPTSELVVGSFLTPAVAVPVEPPEAEEDDVLLRAAARAAEKGVEARLVEQTGATAEAIVAVADALDADLLVIGSRGLGTLGRVALGSTSRAVLTRTRRPVLVVRAAAVPVAA